MGRIEDLIDKATSEFLINGQEDIVSNLEICDSLRGKQASPKDVLKHLKKRLSNKNPNVQILTLKLIDYCVKNGGHNFLLELTSRDFVDNFIALIQTPNINAEFRLKALEYVQYWGLVFQSKPDLRYMTEKYNYLKSSGFSFPPAPKVDVSFLETQTAPDWSKSDSCFRCRTAFSITSRRHHCRNCGNAFCAKCSSRSLPLPKLGINEPTRVCDICYSTLNPNAGSEGALNNIPAAAVDDDLQKAIQLSLMENAPPPAKKEEVIEDDPMLAAAIAASLAEQEEAKKKTLKTSKSMDKIPSVYPSTEKVLMRASSYNTSVPALEKEPNQDEEISAVDRENINLYCQLIEQIQKHGDSVSRNQALTHLHNQMITLKSKIERVLNNTKKRYDEVSKFHESVVDAVQQYDQVLEQRLRHIHEAPQTNASYPSYVPPPGGSYPHYAEPGAYPYGGQQPEFQNHPTGYNAPYNTLYSNNPSTSYANPQASYAGAPVGYPQGSSGAFPPGQQQANFQPGNYQVPVNMQMNQPVNQAPVNYAQPVNQPGYQPPSNQGYPNQNNFQAPAGYPPVLNQQPVDVNAPNPAFTGSIYPVLPNSNSVGYVSSVPQNVYQAANVPPQSAKDEKPLIEF